jgi:hypothetical protein
VKGLPRIAWVGLAILAVAAILLSLGQRETVSFPAADSFAPSGSAALADLLEQQGYKVAIDRSLRPKLAKGDLVLAFEIPKPSGFMSEVQKEVDAETLTSTSEFEKPPHRELLAHLRSGGRAILLPLASDYLAASRAALAQPIDVAPITGGNTLQVSLGTARAATAAATSELEDTHTVTRLWTDSEGDGMVLGVRVGDGTAFLLWNGIVGTNRFIDRADNATLLLNLVSVLAPKGSRIVFTEATFGNIQEKGLLEAIGGWADAAWQQILLLGLVIVYTLGKRLGLPEETKGKQRGSRELVDAIAGTMNRAHATGPAMRATLDRADTELRMALKLPRETERARRDELLPMDLTRALADLEAASQDADTSSAEAARRVQRLDRELDAFLGTRRLTRAEKARI